MKAKKKEDISSDNNSKVQGLNDIIASLQSLIDQIDSCFREAKALILELARRLDEEGVCERGHVCREIKKILKDKISQGKITETWIEECLPAEYKRRYNKSKLSLLSKLEGADQRLIQVDNAGEQVIKDNKGSEDADPSEIQERNDVEFKDETNIQDSTNDGNSRGYTFLIETSELKIHKSELVFTIRRESYQEISDAMKKSTDFIQMTFDQLGPFIHAEPDV